MYCKNCGTLLSEGARFCRNCGTLIDDSAYQQVLENERDSVVEQNGQIDTVEKNTSAINVDYERMYQYAEQGVMSHILDRIYDQIFGIIIGVKIIRVNGYQLALILKKQFIDQCETEEDVERFRSIPKLNLAGKRFMNDSIICFNKGSYRWIKDCNSRIIWELKSDILGTECRSFRKSVQKILDEKSSQLNLTKEQFYK